MRDLFEAVGCDGDSDEDTGRCHNYWRSILTGTAKEIFTAAANKLIAENDVKTAAEKRQYVAILVDALNEVALRVFPTKDTAYNKQRRYMQQYLMIGEGTVQEFYDRLVTMNDYLPYFPRTTTAAARRKFDEEELIWVLDVAKKPHWIPRMIEQGQSVDNFTMLIALKEFFEKLEDADNARQKLRAVEQDEKQNEKKRKNETDDDVTPSKRRKKKGSSGNGNDGKKACKFCGKVHKSRCWNDPTYEGERPKWWKAKKGGDDKNKMGVQKALMAAMLSNEEIFSMVMDNIRDKQPKAKRKRFVKTVNWTNVAGKGDNKKDNFAAHLKVDETSSSDECEWQSSDSEFGGKSNNNYNKKVCLNETTTASNTSATIQTQGEVEVKTVTDDDDDDKNDATPPEHAYPFVDHNKINKKAKNKHYCAKIIIEIEDRDGNLVPARALVDTGTMLTIVLRKFVRKGRAHTYKKPKPTVWKTLGGVFKMKRKALINFKFPELSTTKSVTWACHVNENALTETSLYDMIVGMDLLTEISLYVDTEAKVIHWEGAEIPLKERGDLHDAGMTQVLYFFMQEPDLLQAAEERQSCILDADYSAVDIADYVNEQKHLTTEEKELLTTTLNKRKMLFSGGLGTLNVKPIHLELTPDAKPYHARAFPVPQSLEATTRKEIERLTTIGVLRKCYNSEWAAPSFVQPKKTGDVRVLTDFRKLNAVLKRKPFPLPKIGDMLQKLSGFKYATAIDLSMGYYHIPLDEESQQLCTTILPWGKYQFQHLPMGIKNSPDIFQAVMEEVLGDIDYARTYIDDILVTSLGSFEDHCAKLDTVLECLEKAGF